MSSHSTDILGHTPEAVAEAVASLRYDALEAFFAALEKRFLQDSQADEGRGRPRLAFRLYCISIAAQTAKLAAEKAWKVCAKHMGELPKP